MLFFYRDIALFLRFLNERAAFNILSLQTFLKFLYGLDLEDWKNPPISRAEVPQQSDGSSCGMFVLIAMKCFAINGPYISNDASKDWAHFIRYV